MENEKVYVVRIDAGPEEIELIYKDRETAEFVLNYLNGISEVPWVMDEVPKGFVEK